MYKWDSLLLFLCVDSENHVFVIGELIKKLTFSSLNSFLQQELQVCLYIFGTLKIFLPMQALKGQNLGG